MVGTGCISYGIIPYFRHAYILVHGAQGPEVGWEVVCPPNRLAGKLYLVLTAPLAKNAPSSCHQQPPLSRNSLLN